MLVLDSIDDLPAHVGTLLGRSAYRTVTQADFDAFGTLTGDDNWFHVDPERAAREMPGGSTIAHGLFILSLAPRMQADIYRIEQRGRGLNYGYDRVRFIRPIAVGSRVRLALGLVAAAPHRLGMRVETDQTMEVAGEDEPAVIARNILLLMRP